MDTTNPTEHPKELIVNTKATPASTNKVAVIIRPVLIRLPEPMHQRITAHAKAMSERMGGARVSFTAAALSLMQGGLEHVAAA